LFPIHSPKKHIIPEEQNMKKSRIRIFAFAAAALLALAAAAHADTLATWPLNNTLEGTSGIPDALSASEITAGSAVTSLSLSGKGWNGQGWNSASRNDNAYFQFSVTATDDFYLNLGELAMNFRSTKTGPAKAEVRWSLNGTSWTSVGTYDVPLDGNDKGHPFTADCTDVTVESGKTLTIRIYAWGASSKTGTFRIGNSYPMTLAGTAIGTKLPPTIVFPNEAETVSLSNTLTVAIGVLPEKPEGRITKWSFEPTPAGNCSLSDKTFTFTPLASDVGNSFTLSVTATNTYGTNTATLAVAVTEYVPAGAWMTGFETGNDPKNPSSPTNWVVDGRTWSIQQLSFSDKADLPKVGARACVFGSYNPAFMVSTAKMLDATNGFGTVSFLYGEYPGESEPCQPIIVEIATDLASDDWMEVGRVNPSGVSSPTKATFDVSSSEPVYLRIRTEYVNKSGRVCIDQLTVLPYAAPSWNPFETYLLKYNVTPGDPGCASQNFWAEDETKDSYQTDDFDEDGFSNWAEFNANPQTNPYDRNSHP
jgi:hypothetical protein